MPVLEVLERTIETQRAGPAKGPEDDYHRIEFAAASKVPEERHRQRKAPARALRPVENDGTTAHSRQDLLLEVLLPHRAVRVHDERPVAAGIPDDPDDRLENDAVKQ